MNITRRIKQILIVSALFYGWHIPFDSTVSLAQNVIAAERVTFEGPGGNVGAMNETAKITKVEVGLNGVNVNFTRQEGANRWPNTCGRPFVDPADDCKEDGGRIDMGALQYSLGFVLPVNGQLYGSAPIEYWYGRRDGTGAIQDQSVTCANGQGQMQCNIYYDGRWPNLRQSRPQPGDEVGVFVVAGDARNNYVPLQERSNIVTFKLPAPGQTVTVEYGGGGQAGESVAQTLKRERDKYGATINSAQGAAILNATAWAHRSEGLALLGKSGGSHCTQPTSGTAISCDYLIVNRGGVWFGQDVLVAAPADGEANSPGGPANDITFPDNMQDMINSGARSVVQAVDPGGDTGGGGGGGGGTDTALAARVAALEAANATLQASVNNLTAQLNDARGELSAQRDVLNNFLAQLGAQGQAIEELKALVGKPIPVSCRAKANLGGFSIPLSCSLGF